MKRRLETHTGLRHKIFGGYTDEKTKTRVTPSVVSRSTAVWLQKHAVGPETGTTRPCSGMSLALTGRSHSMPYMEDSVSAALRSRDDVNEYMALTNPASRGWDLRAEVHAQGKPQLSFGVVNMCSLTTLSHSNAPCLAANQAHARCKHLIHTVVSLTWAGRVQKDSREFGVLLRIYHLWVMSCLGYRSNKGEVHDILWIYTVDVVVVGGFLSRLR